jgi:hypothetical protein
VLAQRQNLFQGEPFGAAFALTLGQIRICLEDPAQMRGRYRYQVFCDFPG